MGPSTGTGTGTGGLFMGRKRRYADEGNRFLMLALNLQSGRSMMLFLGRPVVPAGGAGGAMVPPDLGRSFSYNPNQEFRLCPPHY